MGFLEKLKNTFFEEEYVEVEEKPKVRVKKEPIKDKELKKEIKQEVRKEIKRADILEEEKPRVVRKENPVMTNTERINHCEEKNDVQVISSKKEELKEAKTLKKDVGFSYFDDDDFLDLTEEYDQPASSLKKEKSNVSSEKPKLYDNPTYASKTSSTTVASSSHPYSKQTKAGFKPTPIISPIYGILDQNYTKDEVLDKKETKPSSYVSRKNADLDSVREKAFGSLTGDFGLTSSSGDKIKKEEDSLDLELESEDNLLFDMTDHSKTPTVDKVTLQDAEEYFQDLGLEYNIDYKDAKLERATGRRVSKTPKLDDIEEEKTEEVAPSKKTIMSTEKRRKQEEDTPSMEDNLFDLIDSMYEEKE